MTMTTLTKRRRIRARRRGTRKTIKKTLSEPKIRLVLIKKRRNGKDDTVERKRKRVKLSGRVLTPSEDALKSIFLAEGKPLVAWSMTAIPPVPMTEKENLAWERLWTVKFERWLSYEYETKIIRWLCSHTIVPCYHTQVPRCLRHVSIFR